MAKPKEIELPDDTVIPILYEDRSVIAVDKPRGWMLAPDSWDKNGRNLQLAIESSLSSGAFWARSRNLKYLRFIHRLDADTSGVLLLARSAGALSTLSELFESRRVEKKYLAVVRGVPRQSEWVSRGRIAPVEGAVGLMCVDERDGKDAETTFRVLRTGQGTALVEACPATGRTHQIRLHLADSGHPVLGDILYGLEKARVTEGFARLALRATSLAYPDPFQRRTIRVEAPVDAFLSEYGFAPIKRPEIPMRGPAIQKPPTRPRLGTDVGHR